MPGLIETIRICGQTTGIPEKTDVKGSAKDSFIGAEPLKALFRRNGKSLIGNGALRGPQPYRLRAEYTLVIFAGAAELLTRVLRVTIGTEEVTGTGGVGLAID